jgi:hypothetical protein
MTPAEKEYYLQLINKKYGARANAGGALDMAGTALGFVDDAVSPSATKLQDFIARNVTKIDPKTPLNIGSVPTSKGNVINMLKSPAALNSYKVLTGLGAVGGVLGAADIVAGQDSAANKLMDTAAMSVGGFLGAAGGPVGIAAGAGTGKMVSDGLQWLFGDKKSAEQRKLEEALAQLQRGGI